MDLELWSRCFSNSNSVAKLPPRSHICRTSRNILYPAKPSKGAPNIYKVVALRKHHLYRPKATPDESYLLTVVSVYILQVILTDILSFLCTTGAVNRMRRRDRRRLVRSVSRYPQLELARDELRVRTGLLDGQVALFVRMGPSRVLLNGRNEALLARLESADNLEQFKAEGIVSEPAVIVLVERDGAMQRHGDEALGVVLEEGCQAVLAEAVEVLRGCGSKETCYPERDLCDFVCTRPRSAFGALRRFFFLSLLLLPGWLLKSESDWPTMGPGEARWLGKGDVLKSPELTKHVANTSVVSRVQWVVNNRERVKIGHLLQRGCESRIDLSSR